MNLISIVIFLISVLIEESYSFTSGCSLDAIKDYPSACSRTKLTQFTNAVNINWFSVGLWTASTLAGSCIPGGGPIAGASALGALAVDTIDGVKANQEQYAFQQAINAQFVNLQKCMDEKITNAFATYDAYGFSGIYNLFSLCPDYSVEGGDRIDCFRDVWFMFVSDLPSKFSTSGSESYLFYENRLPVYEIAMDVYILAVMSYLDELYDGVINNINDERDDRCDSYNVVLDKALEDIEILRDWIYDARDKLEEFYTPPFSKVVSNNCIFFKQEDYRSLWQKWTEKDDCNKNNWWIIKTVGGGSQYPVLGSYEGQWRKNNEHYHMMVPISDHNTICEFNAGKDQGFECRDGSCNNHLTDRTACCNDIRKEVNRILDVIADEITAWKQEFYDQYISAIDKFIEQLDVYPYCRGPHDCDRFDSCDKYFDRDNGAENSICSMTNDCDGTMVCCDGRCRERVEDGDGYYHCA